MNMYTEAAVEYGTFDPRSNNYRKVPEGCPLNLWRLYTDLEEAAGPFLMDEEDTGPPVHLRGPWGWLTFGPNARVTVICDNAFRRSILRHPGAEVTLLTQAPESDTITVNGVTTASRRESMWWVMARPCPATWWHLIQQEAHIFRDAVAREAEAAGRALITGPIVYEADGSFVKPSSTAHLHAMSAYVAFKEARIVHNPKGPMRLFNDRGWPHEAQ